MGNEECCCGECDCPLGTDCCPDLATVSMSHGGSTPLDYFGGGILTLSNAFVVFDLTCFPFPDITAWACQWSAARVISATPGVGQEHWRYLAWLYRDEVDPASPLRAYVVASHFKNFNAGVGLTRVAEYFLDSEIREDDWDCDLEEPMTLNRCYENTHPDAPASPGTLDVTLAFTI